MFIFIQCEVPALKKEKKKVCNGHIVTVVQHTSKLKRLLQSNSPTNEKQCPQNYVV